MSQLRRALRAWKAKRGCVDCGCKDPDLLDCDHVTGEKVGNVGELSMALLTVELGKIEVRCKKCHDTATRMRRALEAVERDEVDAIVARHGHTLL